MRLDLISSVTSSSTASDGYFCCTRFALDGERRTKNNLCNHFIDKPKIIRKSFFRFVASAISNSKSLPCEGSTTGDRLLTIKIVGTLSGGKNLWYLPTVPVTPNGSHF